MISKEEISKFINHLQTEALDKVVSENYKYGTYNI